MHFRKMVCGQAVLGLLVLFPLLAGCGQKIEPQTPPLVETRIRKLNSFYQAFSTTNNKKPASAEELKTWAKKLSKTKLAEMQVEDVDEVFVAPRDNKPYVITAKPAGAWMVVAYEQTGTAGKRYVMTATGSALELDDTAMKQVMH